MVFGRDRGVLSDLDINVVTILIKRLERPWTYGQLVLQPIHLIKEPKMFKPINVIIFLN